MSETTTGEGSTEPTTEIPRIEVTLDEADFSHVTTAQLLAEGGDSNSASDMEEYGGSVSDGPPNYDALPFDG